MTINDISNDDRMKSMSHVFFEKLKEIENSFPSKGIDKISNLNFQLSPKKRV